MDLVLHSVTRKAIDNFLSRPSHALLLYGPAGSGKGSVALQLTAQLLDISQPADSPYVLLLGDGEKGVSIDDIRRAQTFVQLKTPGTKSLRRAIIIEQGETMSSEAQNALLKLLEEPPADTVLIITSQSLDRLLPTIRSRAQPIRVLAPTLSELTDFFSPLYSDPEIKKAYYISEGYPGLMQALLTGDETHPLVEQIAIAKTLLSSSAYDRLAQVDTLSKQKNLSLLLQAMERVCHAALTQAVNASNPTAKRWTKRLEAIVRAENSLTHNPSAKLLLTNLMLGL